MQATACCRECKPVALTRMLTINTSGLSKHTYGVVLFFLSLSLSYRMMESKTPQEVVEFLKEQNELKGQTDVETLFQGLVGMY